MLNFLEARKEIKNYIHQTHNVVIQNLYLADFINIHKSFGLVQTPYVFYTLVGVWLSFHQLESVG